MDLVTNYYGIDWLLFLFIAIFTLAIGERKRWGWLFAIAGSICGITLGIMMQSAASILMNAVFVVMNLINYIKWKSGQ